MIEVSKKKRRTHFIEDSLAIKRESINNESAFVKTVANLKRFHFANTESALHNKHAQTKPKKMITQNILYTYTYKLEKTRVIVCYACQGDQQPGEFCQ